MKLLNIENLKVDRIYCRTWNGCDGQKFGKKFKVIKIVNTIDPQIGLVRKTTVEFCKSGSIQTLCQGESFEKYMYKEIKNKKDDEMKLENGKFYQVSPYGNRFKGEKYKYIGSNDVRGEVFLSECNKFIAFPRQWHFKEFVNNIVKFKSKNEIYFMKIPDHWQLEIGDTLVHSTEFGNKYYEVLDLAPEENVNHVTKAPENMKRINLECL